jgi:hypothetical protein
MRKQVWVEAPNIASFLGTGGKRRVIDPALLGAPVSHPGHLVTHANTVRFGETAKLCVGPFGGLAGLLSSDCQVFADGVFPLDHDGCAQLLTVTTR